MTPREPAPIFVQDGRDLGYASVPQAVVERLRGQLMAAPLARALGASVLVASELNLAQIRDGAPVWAPDKHTLSERLMLSEHAARSALAALEQAAMITVERGRYDGSARLPNRISLISDHGAFCAVTRRTIAAISRQCLNERRGRPQALAVYLTLVWEANRQRAHHIEEPRKRATVSYPALAGLTGVSEAHVRRVIGGLMACHVLEDVTQRFAATNGRRTAKTWRLVEPPAVEQPLETPAEPAITQSPRTDHTVAEDRSPERQGPLTQAPRTAQGCAEDQSPERRGPLNGAPTRAHGEQHEQQSATANPHGSRAPGGGGEGDLPGEDVAVVIEQMVRMLGRRAAGNERRARRRAQDPAWATAARVLFDDGFTASQLAELIAFAETDLAVGHRVTCLPSLNAQLDALQARRSAVGERVRPAAVSPAVEALVELVMRSLRQAPPRASRQHHLEIAERLDATLTAEHTAFLAGLPWRELGQRDQGTLRHSILDLWRAHEHLESRMTRPALATATPAPGPRVPLHDLNAEQAVLGAVLLSDATMHSLLVEVGLSAEDFYREQHGAIFTAMSALHEAGQPIDAITLAARMRAEGTFDPKRTQAELDILSATVPAIGNYRRYAELVRETAVRRRIIRACWETIGTAHDTHADDALAIATDAAAALQDLGRDLTGRLEISARDAVRDQDEQFERRKQGDFDDLLLTGYPDLDDLLEGLEPGSLYYVAARPGVGKTAFGLGLVHNFTSDDPTLGPACRCLLYTLEMSAVQIIQRMVAARARVSLSTIRRPDRHPVSDGDLRRIHEAQAWVRERPFELVPRSVRLGELAGHARWLATRYRTTSQPLRCIIVDYVQLVNPDERGDSRYREVTDISLGLKRLAVDLELPVIAMAQLSRESERRGNHKPQLSDLRDSGQLEQDAHGVLLLYRDELYDPDTDDAGVLQVDVAKNRQGSLGVCKLAAHLETQRIMSLAPDAP